MTPPISFTEDGLDELETNLREIQPGFDGCVTGHALALKAADAIARLRLQNDARGSAINILEREKDAQSRRIAEVEAKHAANHDAWVDTHASALKRIAELQRALEEAIQAAVILSDRTVTLTARAEAAEKDAARYRWLRKAWIISTQGIHRGIWMNLDVAASQSNDDDPADAFDASIDAALATAQPSEGSE